MTSLTQTRVEGRRRIYLVRHADVSYFSAEGTALDTRTVRLNAAGRTQAGELGEMFRDIPIDRVVVSGLVRTRETADLLLAGRSTAIRSLGVEECADLVEIRAGKVTNWAPGLLSSPGRIEEFFIGSLNRELTPGDTFLGGETFGDFAARVVPAFERLVMQPGWKDLLLVAHGGTNRAILAHALGASPQAMGALEQDPACVNIIDVAFEPTDEPPYPCAGSVTATRPLYLVRLLNYTAGAPLKKDIRMTTMEKIFTESRDAILALAERRGT